MGREAPQSTAGLARRLIGRVSSSRKSSGHEKAARRRTRALRMTVLGIVGWVMIGAGIGYHAAPRRGFSRTSGVVSGAPWGVLAVLLYFFDWPYLTD
jgi:hypothetical protein